MKLPVKLSKKVVYSYLRHTLGASAAILWAEANFSVLRLSHLTTHDYRMALHATWIAAIFQLRFAVLPLVQRYVTKRYPQFVWVFNDAATVVDTRLSEIAPTPVESTPTGEVAPLPTGDLLPPGTAVNGTSAGPVPIEVNVTSSI